MTEFVQVVTTVGTAEVGEQIAERLVAERLAACVQISGPITSTYHWKGKIEQEREYVCTAKTFRKNYSEIEKIILELHPYDTPEIIATPVLAASKGFLDWLQSELAKRDIVHG
ncbi:MAG: divalent-cation tolerance protein CutA [Desulfobulbaceae bacterium]|nr:divalent-cation tolerance protein CutA [Desulfobulbaceae bacterium]